MQVIGRQLAQLFLAAAPTAIIVFLYYLFLRWSFFGPIERILAERRARIDGRAAVRPDQPDRRAG